MIQARPRFFLRSAAVLLPVLLLAGVFAARSHAGDKKAAAQPSANTPALTVTTARPASARLPLQLGANGNVAAWQEAVIGSESNGLRLREVRVNVGDVVKKGQVLAVFDA